MPRHPAWFAIALACLLAACSTVRTLLPGGDAAHKIEIAQGAELRLPAEPAIEPPFEELQTLIASYDGQTSAFQASVSAQNGEVHVVLLAMSGPRIMDIVWTKDGISETRSAFAPERLSGLNILADIFLVRWPAGDVRKALPAELKLEASDERRMISRNDTRVVEVAYGLVDDQGRSFTRLTHHERGYSLSIYTD